MAIDPDNLATWSPDTIVRCGSLQGARELAERLSRDGPSRKYVLDTQLFIQAFRERSANNALQ
ncbi:MAG: hypothetical protein ACREUZ_16785, partial [Burkholderiales bacterium]